MLVTIKGTELTAITVIGSQQAYQGPSRKTLEFHFASNATTFEQLNTLFTVPGSILITNDTDTYQHDNYALRVSTALREVVVTPETDTEPAVTEQRYVVVMAQRTYMEARLEAVKSQVELIDGALFDLIMNYL